MRIAMLGDLAMFGDFSVDKDRNICRRLENVSDYLSKFDLVIGNLESPFTYKRKTYGAKSGYVGSDPSNIEIVKSLHISAVNLANNHMYDYGPEGLQTTLNQLDANGIPWFGINGKDLRYEKDGNDIVFNGFCCYSTNPLKIASSFGEKGINPVALPSMEKILLENKNKGRLNIFIVHSGIEHVSRPSLDQIKLSRKLADLGSYVWCGHHPHVVQGVDFYKDSIIAHSLGNFIFPEYKGDKFCPKIELTENNRTGMILEVTVENNKITDHALTYVKVNKDYSVSFIEGEKITGEYSSMLKEADGDPDGYSEKRQRQWNDFTSHRKELRNAAWYMRRLRPRYARLLWDYRQNAKKYFKNVKTHL